MTQLKAIKSCQMLYTDNEVESGTKPAAGTPLAWVTMPNMTYPTVQLINSNYFKKVWCHGSTIKMEFNCQAAYEYAWNNWHNKVRQTSDYLVITSEPSCMGSSAGRERHFLRAKTEERDNSTSTISCEIEPIPIQDAVGDDNPVVVDVDEFSTRNTDKGFNVQANDFAGDNTVVNTTDVIRTIGGDSKFDEVLDKQIGFISIEDLNASTKEQFNITIEDFYGESDFPDLAKNAILKRRIGDRIKKAVRKVKAAVKEAVTAVKAVVKTVVDEVVEVAKAVADKIAEITTLDKNINIDIDFDTKQIGSVVTTPFDDAPDYKLFSAKTKRGKGTFEGFCVDYGIEGDFKIGGKFVFIFSRLKLEEGFVTMRGDMGAALQLGLVGSFGFEGSKDKNVTTVNKNGEVFVTGVEKPVGVLPITPFLILGIFSFGPQLKLDIGVDVELEAEGKILMGIRADWPSIDAKVDFVDKSKSSASGFKPDVTPVFEFETQAKLTWC
ncbi:hypothetical protein TWF225_005161 [Orbilia oligospora]|nr:hypothetical protein TWF751_003317 [Orbilia oligospora]KAF3185370.1 hypothetical protein TWF225_005161 [Orbilia oligospora]